MCADKPRRRLFVGLPLNAQEKAALHRLQNSLTGVRWIPPDNLHVTLSFLGSVPEERLPEIHEHLNSVRQPSFSRQCKSAGWWENGVLWSNMLGGERLHQLKSGVDEALSFLNLPPEKHAYFPHVTLARSKAPPPRQELKAWLNAHRKFATPLADTESFALFESIQNEGQTRYTALYSYPLVIIQ